MTAAEVNFDGLVGPTHNYGGLSHGNNASVNNKGDISNPQLAAKQGIAKMRAMVGAGLIQGVLPPHARPHGPTLAAAGFGSDIRRAIRNLGATAPGLVGTVSSASAMWTANAATVIPSVDSADGRLHLVPANLIANEHRAIEAQQTTQTLRAIFREPDRFAVHDPLPALQPFGDEGAANHSRVCTSHAEPGTHVFVYGRDAGEPQLDGGLPRRQTRAASQAVARLGQVDEQRRVFVRQSAAAIDAGAFHNDVVAVVNENVVLCHQDAFEIDGSATLPSVEDVDRFVASWGAATSTEVVPIVVSRDEVSLDDAVSSYLFNSQLVTTADGSMMLVCPAEANDTASTHAALQRIVAADANPITEVRHFDLRQSMRNGGGPACLRLRVVLDEQERSALNGNCIVDHALLDQLDAWVDTHYRSELRVTDLLDPAFAMETMGALDELTSILDLGAIYPFQT